MAFTEDDNKILDDFLEVDDFLKGLRKTKEEYDKTTVKIGIIGGSGVGKSSLINAISGKYVAEVGAKETTDEPLEYTIPGTKVTYVDLPGCGTKKWPTESYLKNLNLLQYDALILLFSSRILEDDVLLFQQLRNKGKKVFLVRSNFDSAINGRCDELSKDSLTEEEQNNLRKEITEYVQKELSITNAEVFYTALLPGNAYFDLEKLQISIFESLDDIKATKLLLGIKAYSKEFLRLKSNKAKNIIKLFSAVAAVNGIKPILGADIAVDIGIITLMNKELAKLYNIDFDEDNVKKNVGDYLARIVPYFGREGVKKLLEKYSKREAAKVMAKFFPAIGNVVGAGLGFGIVYGLGRKVDKDFYEVAEILLEKQSKL